MPLKQLLKSVWMYGWVLIVPLAIFASAADLLLLGGIRLFISIISENWNSFFGIEWFKRLTAFPWALVMLFIIAVRYLLITLRVRSEERLSHRLESHLRVWFIREVKGMHPLNFHKSETGGILHNANQAVATMPQGCKIVTQSIQAVSQLVFFLPVLFFLSWQLTLLLLLVFAPVILYFQRTLKRTSRNIQEFNSAAGDYDSSLWRWSAFRLSWSNGAELSRFMRSLFVKIRNLRNLSIRMRLKDTTIMQNIETLSILIMTVILAICAAFIGAGIMKAADIVLFSAALFICYKPLKDCSQLLSNLRDLRIAYSSLHTLEEMPRGVPVPWTERDEDCIRIEHLKFGYSNNEALVFDDLNSILRLNRPLLLQGENGCGKTTLLRVLSGLETPQGGEIFMPPKASNGRFYLSQRLFLPPSEWLDEAVHSREWGNAAKKLFETLGLEVLLKKQGHSNGELQRLGLAWAVISGAPFLFLDEPFAFIGQDLREPIFKAFWNATTETDQWWMLASHEPPPDIYKERIVYWKLGKN